MVKEDIGSKSKTFKKRNDKYRSKLPHYAIDEKEVLKEMLKSLPVPQVEGEKDNVK